MPRPAVLYASSLGGVTTAYTESGRFWTGEALAAVERRLDPGRFLRLDASHLVNLTRIAELVPWTHQRYRLVFTDAAKTELVLSRDVGPRLRAPNAMAPVIVMGSILVATAILTESALAFLGLGDQNLVSWGGMIGAGREVLRTAWYMTAVPGVAIAATVLGLNLPGDALNDLLNPRLRKRRPGTTPAPPASARRRALTPPGA